MKFLEFLSKQSRFSLAVLCLGSILFLGFIDYLTGAELSFSIFYLLPVSLAAWLMGRTAGISFSIAGAVMWLVADLMAGHIYSHPATPYWNTITRLGFFLIVTQILTGLRSAWERQEELGQFIVHDLRSPLSNIMTGMLILKETASEQLDETQQDLIEMSIISGNRMLTLINSILDLARLERGNIPLKLEEINIIEMVKSSLEQVKVWAQRNNVNLDSNIDEDARVVYADTQLCLRILVNLLSNAIKFSPSGANVSIKVSPMKPGFLIFRIIDQGKGISPEWTEKVFDKFVQVDAHKTGKTIGSGLGLAFCRLAVVAQGGRIWLESQEGMGTTVLFTLPVSSQDRS